LAERLVALGGAVQTRCPVRGVNVKGGRVTGVETARGTIESDTVVLAAGAWSNELLRPLGVYLPAVPQVTSRIITEPLGVPETMPTLFLMGLTPEPGGTFLWVRGQRGALLWGGTYSRHPRNAFVGAPVPPRFDEVPIDGVLECRRLAGLAASFMPLLDSGQSLALKHGAPCYTPDRRGLVGPVPEIDGLHTMAGDNEAGLTNGPGFAKVLADHIVTGSSELASLDPWRIDRFGDRFRADAEVAEALA
jgi:sarcosine oxidase subunit beta